MTAELAFVGDIHGSLAALNGLRAAVEASSSLHWVFLGDYINKGPESRDVLDVLIDMRDAGAASLLAGNHELAMLDALESGDMQQFLKMGGAMTIRSYVRGSVGVDVARDFVRSVPDRHLDALRQMPLEFDADDVKARHRPVRPVGGRFEVSAHVYIGLVPRIGIRSAEIDTGCGTPGGRLTAFLWPSREYLQVDDQGALVST